MRSLFWVTMFDEQTEQMRRIFRGLETYGEGSPSEQATRFRLTEMFPEIIKRARDNSAETPRPDVELLVSLSGFSPATTILAYELVQPRRLLVISSAEADGSIDVIDDHLVGSHLNARHFQHRTCDGTNPLAIYRLVKEAVAAQTPDIGARVKPSAIIDITGGKKVMSAAAALVAWQLDLRLCYIDSLYDGEMRQPIPGTERLLILENPTTIFGDQEMEAALETFRSGAFAFAQQRFSELAESMAEPSRARLLRDLAGLYQAWSDLDASKLPTLAEHVRRGLNDPLTHVAAATSRRLTDQLDLMERLAAPGDLRGIPNFYVLGEHYGSLGRVDFAAMLYYRTLEGCFQQRLKLRFGGFDCGKAQYQLIDVPEDELLDRFNAVLQTIGRPEVTALPGKLGLMDSAILLHILGDKLPKQIDIRDPKGINYLKKRAEARNQSVLAHGDRYISADECNELKSLAQRCLHALWSLHRPKEDIDSLCATLRFVQDV